MVEKIEKIQLGLLVLMLFTLPLSRQLSSIFLVFFYLVSLIVFYNNNNLHILLKHKMLVVCLVSFFLLRLLSFTNTIDVHTWQKETLRSISFALLPISIITFHNRKNILNILLTSLLLGTLVSVLILWVNLSFQIISGNIEVTKLFSNITSNKNFTKPLGIHPSYLGIIINLSAAFLIFSNAPIQFITKQRKNIILIIFLLFSINLMSRTSLFIFVILLFYYFIKNFNIKYSIILASIFFVFMMITINQPNSYLKRKLLYMTKIVNQNDLGDRRFVRLKASYYLFKESPVFGAGIGYDDIKRKAYYKKLREREAYINNHNAHNQFFEYLSTFGLVGALIFLLIFSLLFYYTIKIKNYMLFVFVLIYFISSFTESLHERILGVILFSFISSIVLLKIITTKIIKK